MSKVKFWALINNMPFLVSGLLEESLAVVFGNLRGDPDVAGYIPARVSYHNCKFYRLKKPVPLGEDDTDDENDEDQMDVPVAVKAAIREETNVVSVRPVRTKVSRLAKEFFDDHVYLIIDVPNPEAESINAIADLRRRYSDLFKRLQVTVKAFEKWDSGDVERNLRGGVLTNDITDLPNAFQEIQDVLTQSRVYNATEETAQQRDFRNALSFGTQFHRVFIPDLTGSQTVISHREFAAFYSLLRCFNKDVRLIAHRESSSSLKASNFTVHFIQPPFFSEIMDDSRGFKYRQDVPWGFPIFVEERDSPDAIRKFTPKSDWMVLSPQYRIPFVISEVISNKQEIDRPRMLVQAIALARAGQFLMKSTSEKRFFVVAIYVDANMVASRYVVMETDDGGSDSTEQKPVSIHRQDFDLGEEDKQVDFLREMYNLATQVTALSRELDQSKENDLCDILLASRKVMSLSTKHGTRTVGTATMHSIPEETTGSDGPQDEDDLGIFEAENIQHILHQMNYKIEFIPFGHPHLAVIVSKTGGKHGYLKFVERQKEVDVLRYLTDIKSPSNYTISSVQFWPVEGGTVISMPVAGGWLTSLNKPNEQLWSIALQLVEAVAFMHEHNVAHMDLKPQNVIIPLDGGRLSIIDFSVSIRFRNPDVLYSGVVGTEEYIAPEVRKGPYKPVLADLWSCGRTLQELCSHCRPSVDRTTLLEISRQLMSRDPEARPKMSAVLELMAPTQRGEDGVPPMLTALPTVSVSPLCA